MPRLPAKQREADKVSTQLPSGSYAAAAHDAPPRHAFEAHSLSLLTNLRGDRKKRKQLLNSFIASLKTKREEFRKEKKTGAGSATEAIEFYQYAMDKNTTWKGITFKSKHREEADDIKDKDEKKGEKDDDDDDDDNNDDMKPQCKVCNLDGHLFHCSQPVCKNSFHLQCVRPPLEEIPKNDWNCAFCDVNYVTGLKPQARRRRSSVAAVRAMEKIKSDIQSSKGSSETTMEGSGNGGGGSDGSNGKSNKKRTLDDIYENDPENASKQRRPNTNFNPQGSSGGLKGDSDGGGKGDNVNVNDGVAPDTPEMPAISKGDIPQEILKKLLPKSINCNSKHGQFHCKFCMDNEMTQTCCFCACRVCFSKRDRDRTILCDICDAEYHIDCLSPPLLQIPSTDWFCPNCITVVTQDHTIKKPKKSAPSVKSKKGKGASKSSKAQSKQHKITNADRIMMKATYAANQPRLACGRFASKDSPSPAKPLKRGPGRPPKSASSKTITPKKSGGTGRGRGRPPSKFNLLKKIEMMKVDNKKATDMKNDSKSSKSASKAATPKKSGRGRGRPPSIHKNTKPEKAEKKSDEMKHPSTPVKVEPAEPVIVVLQTSKDPTKREPKKLIKVEEVPTNKILHIAKEGVSTIRTATKNDEPFLPELKMKQNVKETMSENEIQKATAAAVEATVGSSAVQKPHPSQVVSSPAPTSSTATIGDRSGGSGSASKVPRRKPGARECMQISRRFGANIISPHYMETLLDYCTRGKVEHLIRMRERLDEHSRFLESQLAGLEMLIEEKGGQEPPQQSSENVTQNAPGSKNPI